MLKSVQVLGFIVMPGAGIEPARRVAGDFEFACEGVCLGKWGEGKRRLS